MRRALALSMLVSACSASSLGELAAPPTWDVYDGVAFPDHRAPIVLPEGDFALAPSTFTDTVWLADLGAQQVVATRPVGRSPVLVDGPHQIVANMAARLAYVLSAYPPDLLGAPPHSGGDAGATLGHSHGAGDRQGLVQVLSLDDLHIVGELMLPPNPGEIALSEDGKRLVATRYDTRLASEPDPEKQLKTLTVIDPTTIRSFGSASTEERLACHGPHGIALSRPDGRLALLACAGDGALGIVDLSAPSAATVLVPVGGAPYAVALSPDGSRAAVSLSGDAEVALVDVAGQKKEGISVLVQGEPFTSAWSLDGRRLYVPTRDVDAVVVADAVTGTIIAQRLFSGAVCARPVEVFTLADPNLVYLECEGTNALPGAFVALDANTLEVRGRVEVGLLTGRAFFSPRRR